MSSALVDVVTQEVVRAGLLVAAEEASAVVVRSSHSTFIQEGADACAALLDPEGQLVAQSVATTLTHSSSLRCALPEILRPLREYRDIFAGLILMGVIIYLPRGLVTLAELRKTRRLQEIGAADVA